VAIVGSQYRGRSARPSPGRRAIRASRVLSIVVVTGALALALAAAPTARADSRTTALAVLRAQLELLAQQKALNKCLEASPTKNTPCTRRNSLKLAGVADRHIKLIQDGIDGTEVACVLQVAQQQVALLRIWRNGAMALYRNERKKAKRLFVSSLRLETDQAKVQPQCFAEVLAGGG
jgi:hypothetical protein